MPQCIKDAIDSGKVTQWRRYPNTLFVVGVDKARIVYDRKKKTIGYKYVKNIRNNEQFNLFKAVFNELKLMTGE